MTFTSARFIEEERVEVWDRWQAGDANRLIGQVVSRITPEHCHTCNRNDLTQITPVRTMPGHSPLVTRLTGYLTLD